MKKMVIIYIILIVSQIHSANESRSMDLLIFIDQTGSISNEEFKLWETFFTSYLDNLENNLGQYDRVRIRIQPIHKNTFTASPIRDISFSGRREIKYRIQRKKLLEDLRTIFKQIGDISTTNNSVFSKSDIFGSIDQALNFFKTADKTNKEIIYFSDMIQCTSSDNFENKDYWENRNIEERTNKMLREQFWSYNQFYDVNINIIKPGTPLGISNKVEKSTLKCIDRFWDILFKKLGATIIRKPAV